MPVVIWKGAFLSNLHPRLLEVGRYRPIIGPYILSMQSMHSTQRNYQTSHEIGVALFFLRLANRHPHIHRIHHIHTLVLCEVPQTFGLRDLKLFGFLIAGFLKPGETQKVILGNGVSYRYQGQLRVPFYCTFVDASCVFTLASCRFLQQIVALLRLFVGLLTS